MMDADPRWAGGLVTLEGGAGGEDCMGAGAAPPSENPSSSEGSEGITRSRTHDFASYLDRMKDSILLSK